jgi:hypothetical protein
MSASFRFRFLEGGHLEDIASLPNLSLRRGRVDDLPRRETAGGRLGCTVQLQADEAAACSSFG